MSQTRQLAAIIFTDIVGYTALMGEDEQKAFDMLNKNRQIQRPLIEQHKGKWIKELGDGVLASFATVSDAVTCAIAIQKICNRDCDFQLRIGIHQGEVIFENEDVFGDAVNIASRIQALAPIGGIWVSEAVQHNVSNKQDIQTNFVKEVALKHVKEPVRIYEVVTGFEAEKPAAAVGKETKNQQRKSIVVLPFVNISNDPEQEYFSDGMTEEIITDLSALHDLLVISRSSAMTFKNSNKKIRDIASELHVHYVLEGSVRKAGNNLRITAQLIDAGTDVHLWAEKYNGTLDDVFDIQEKVSRAIVDALKVKLTTQEDKKISERPIENAHAYDCYLRARSELLKWNTEAIGRAQKYIENALDIIGPNALLYGAMGYVCWSYANLGVDADANYASAKEFADKSFEKDNDSPTAHLVMANLNISFGKPLDCLRHFQIVLKNNPNDLDGLVWASLVHMTIGNFGAAQALLERLVKVDPISPITHAWPGILDFYRGNFASAVQPLYKAWKMEPENPYWYLFILLTHAYNNQPSEAIAFIEENLDPDAKGLVPEIALMIKPALQKEKLVLQSRTA